MSIEEIEYYIDLVFTLVIAAWIVAAMAYMYVIDTGRTETEQVADTGKDADSSGRKPMAVRVDKIQLIQTNKIGEL